jgi:hypothetical protein
MLAAGPLSCMSMTPPFPISRATAAASCPAHRSGPERDTIATRRGGEQPDAVQLPVGRAEERRGLPCDLSQHVVGAGQLPVSFPLGDLAEVWVAPGVISDLVSLVAGTPDQIRVRLRVDADREEGRRDAAPFQDVKNIGV